MNTTIIEFEIPSKCSVLKENQKIKIIAREIHKFQGENCLFVMMEMNGFFYGSTIIRNTTIIVELINSFLSKKLESCNNVLNKKSPFLSDFQKRTLELLRDEYEFIRKVFDKQTFKVKDIQL